MSNPLRLLSILLALGPAAAAQDAPPVFRLLPRDTIAAVGVAGAPAVKAAFEESTFGRLWAEKEVKDWLAPVTRLLDQAMEQMKGEVGFTVADLWDTMEGGVALALLAVEKVEGKSEPGFSVGLVADFGSKRERFESLVEKAIEKGRDAGDISRSEEEYRGVKVQVLNPSKPTEGSEEEPRFRFAFVGSLLACAVSNLREDRLEALIDRAQGKDEENALLRADRFRKSAAKVGAGQLLLYGDLERVWKVVRGSGDPDGDAKAEAVGVFALHSAAFSLGIGKEGTRAAAYLGGARSGLFSLAQMPTGEFRTPGLVPADVVSYSAYRLELKKVWEVLERIFAGVGEEGETGFRSGIQAFEKEIGFSIRDDLLASFGDEVALYSARRGPEEQDAFAEQDPESAMFSGFARATVLLTLRRPEKVEGYLEALLKRAGLGATLKTEEYQGRRIHSLMVAMVPLAYAVAGDLLVLGLAPERVQEVLRRVERPDTPSLQKSERFAQALAGLPKPRASVGFSNAEASVEEMERAFGMVGGMLGKVNVRMSEAGNAGPPIDFATLFKKVPFATVRRHWKRDSASTLVPDGDGVLWVSIGP
ncbi:MAG TPA: hypothetical protein VFI25_06945 [Planctomycetota bacterium]|jgi:hypothetical protein|nr:hypothetical protein [Planctomycetota bacterium]